MSKQDSGASPEVGGLDPTKIAFWHPIIREELRKLELRHDAGLIDTADAIATRIASTLLRRSLPVPDAERLGE